MTSATVSLASISKGQQPNTQTMFTSMMFVEKSESLGSSVPDAFLFDFKDEENPEFYLVEVELLSLYFSGYILQLVITIFLFIWIIHFLTLLTYFAAKSDMRAVCVYIIMENYISHIVIRVFPPACRAL